MLVGAPKPQAPVLSMPLGGLWVLVSKLIVILTTAHKTLLSPMILNARGTRQDLPRAEASRRQTVE